MGSRIGDRLVVGRLSAFSANGSDTVGKVRRVLVV